MSLETETMKVEIVLRNTELDQKDLDTGRIVIQNERNTIILLDRVAGSDGFIFKIPSSLTESDVDRILIHDMESGGMNEQGQAEGIIVCSFRGHRLRPYWVARDDRKIPNGTVAKFWISSGYVRLEGRKYATSGMSSIQIFHVRSSVIDDDGLKVKVEKELIATGEEYGLQEDFRQYSFAVDMMSKKLDTKNCTEMLYGEIRR